MMKACILTGAGRLEVREVPLPRVEADGMLVKVCACGICGSDIRNYLSGPRLGKPEQVMGHEIAGVVADAGKNVKNFAVGDRVTVAPDVSCGECYYCRKGLGNLCLNHKMVGTHWPGGYAQYVYLDNDILSRGMVLRMPDALDFYAATLAEPLSSVVAAQEYNNVSLGDTVVVIGDGPIGCFHLQIARTRGARTIMVGLTRLDTAALFDPDHIIDAGAQDPVEEVLKLTGGLGADVAITANSVAKTHAQAVEMVRKRGRVILFGGLPRDKSQTCFDGNKVHYGEISVVGAFSYTSDVNQKAVEYLSRGLISTDRLINRIVTLDEVQDVIEAARNGEVLKAVIDPWK